MAKVTIRFVYERDYEIPDMGWFCVGDALVNYGQIYNWEDGKVTDNIFNNPVSDMRYVGNLYDWIQGRDDSDAWEPLEEEETSDA